MKQTLDAKKCTPILEEVLTSGVGFLSCIRRSIFHSDKFDMSDSLDRVVHMLDALDSLRFS